MADDAKLHTRKRMEEIDRELNELRKEYEGVREQWEAEKLHIQTLRGLKSAIETVKQEASEAEREGNYARVAELRYGTLLELRRKLESANKELIELQRHSPMLKEEIGAEDIAEIVARWTGIPVQRMMETERTKLLKMEERLHERVVGQDESVVAISNAIRRSRAGLHDARKPIGSFIFLGTTGVGKTEMARALAEFLFDDENALVRIDMSEYMEKHAVSRMLGATPGYVGYEEGGQLTEAVRRHPYSVVLLDEIEKAHPDVFNVLLQVLDDGRLTDGQGRVVDFRNTIVIMTSNLGTELMQDRLLEITEANRDEILAALRLQIMDLLRKRLRPEFLNRIDEIILFKPIIDSEIQHIAQLQLNAVGARLKDLGVTFSASPIAVEWLGKRGYDVQYGARPLKRVIQRYVSDPLSLKVLAAEITTGDHVTMDADDNGQMTFHITREEGADLS